jgi:hypothetical protein
LLSKNTEGLEIIAVHCAVSSTSGFSRVYDTGQGHWAYRTHPAHADDENVVPNVTINELYKANASFFPFIVKIDIEGAEKDLFSGNTEWVARTPLVIVELHDWMLPKDGMSRSFLQCISQLDRGLPLYGTGGLFHRERSGRFWTRDFLTRRFPTRCCNFERGKA